MSEIGENLAGIKERIHSACIRVSRDPASVELIAVSKTFPASSVRDALEFGQNHFGESKLQEAEPKIELLPSSLHWHFIGRIQKNKVRRILSSFEVIHAIDSLALASYVNAIAEELGLFPKIFLQLNVGDEASKGGFDPALVKQDMEELLRLDRLDILGLMCIPPAGPTSEDSRRWFAMLREVRDDLEREFDFKLPGLSMGMSGDFEIAIEEGATHVRVGSAIFGKRSYRVDGELG